jgi:hypothetical protein
MQPPLFDVAQPQYLNHGGLGAVAARELARTAPCTPPSVHGLVDETDASRASWTPAEGCSSSASAGEGSEASAAAAADAANEAWVRGRSMRDHDLPGLERRFTHEQLFFVGGGAARCGERARHRAESHAPVYERVFGGAARSRAFREALKCKA